VNSMAFLVRANWLLRSFSIACLFLATALQARGSGVVEPLVVQELDVANRVHFGFRFSELDRDQLYERERSLYLTGEWAILDSLSIYGSLPYVERTSTEAERRRYLDHIQAGVRFAPSIGNFHFGMGLTVLFSRGSDQGDVKKDVGYLQPYLGILYNGQSFFAQASVLWSSQTNPRFIEDLDQQFDRSLIFDFAMGFRMWSLDLMLENRYDYRYDPDERKRVHWLLGPTVRWNVTESFSMSLGVPYAIRKERDEDVRIHFQLTYRWNP